jgi:hypothetical protein
VPSADNIKDIFTVERPITQPKVDISDSDDDDEAEPIRVCFHYDSEEEF